MTRLMRSARSRGLRDSWRVRWARIRAKFTSDQTELNSGRLDGFSQSASQVGSIDRAEKIADKQYALCDGTLPIPVRRKWILMDLSEHTYLHFDIK